MGNVIDLSEKQLALKGLRMVNKMHTGPCTPVPSNEPGTGMLLDGYVLNESMSEYMLFVSSHIEFPPLKCLFK